MQLKRAWKAIALGVAIAFIAGSGETGAAGPNNPVQLPHYIPPSSAHVCSAPLAPGQSRCHALVRTDPNVVGHVPAPSVPGASPAQNAEPNVLGNNGAYDPAYLQSAYSLTNASALAGPGRVVAVVDAFDNPNAESDLAQYRSHFGLPPCTSASGCFRKVNQTGSTWPLPAPNISWAEEISVDLDMVSAICPRCGILLVEANSTNFNDLGVAENTAVSMGAVAVSNSYGGSEWSSETSYEAAYYKHPGVAIVASTGDAGYGVEFPAASQYVVAAGGTSLNQQSNGGSRDGSEIAWSGSGSGCSRYEPKPAWQHDSGCAARTVADVAAVADPSTGVWGYDSYGTSGWLVFGGTSVASPIIAATYALAGASGPSDFVASYPYAKPQTLFDVTSGSNGSCSPAYLCHATAGYDGPTGLGSPNSTAAFLPGLALSPTPTPTLSPTATPSITPTPSVTRTPGATQTASATATASPTASATNTSLPTATNTPTATSTPPPSGPTFTLSATAVRQTAARNGTSTAQYTVNVTSLNGYSRPVTLAVSGLPTGATGYFLPGVLFGGGNTSLIVRASFVTPAGGPLPLTIKATGSDGQSSTVTVQLTVV